MITPDLKKKIDKLSTPIIILCWVSFFLIHLKLYGVVTNLEAGKYIHEAENLVNNKSFSSLRFWFYSITILIITLSLKLKIGFIGAVFIQSFINLLALLFFHRSLKLIFQSSVLFPLLIICVAILFSPYSSWNVFLFTESIFYSSILLLIASIIYHSYHKKSWSLLAILFSLCITIFSRPLGILFIPAIVFYFYLRVSKPLKLIIVLPLTVVGAVILLYITNVVFTTTADTTITLSAKQGCVVCGIIPATNETILLLPAASPLRQLTFYISHNFHHFIQLAMERLRAFFLMTRVYYSAPHNIFLLFFILPLYSLSLISFSIKKDKNFKPVFYFIISSIATFAIAIMLQCDDYHNRFILGLFPFFLILACKTLAFKNNITPPSLSSLPK